MDLITLALSKKYTNKVVSEAQLAPTSFKVVDVLPATGEIGIIYLVPKANGKDRNIYTEYIWTNDAFEAIGDTEIDLQDYATIEYVDNSTVARFNLDNFSNLSEDAKIKLGQDIYDAYKAGKTVKATYTQGDMEYTYYIERKNDYGLQLGCPDVMTDANGTYNRNVKETIWIATTGDIVNSVGVYGSVGYSLDLFTDYSEPYMPEYDGSPATKKYVDDSISSAITAAIEGAY